MPARKTRKSKKVAKYRRRMIGIRRSQVGGIIRPHNFKRSVLLASGISTGTGLGGGTLLGSIQPTLSQLYNVSEFGALYDQYRINFVVVKIIWRSTSVSMMETQDRPTYIGAPYCIWTLDRDDTNTPTSVNQIREYAQSKQHYFSDAKRVLYIKWKPNTLTDNYQSPVATSYTPKWKQWIDIADGGATAYYGVKYALISPNGGNPNAAAYFDIEATYYFQMRNPR